MIACLVQRDAVLCVTCLLCHQRLHHVAARLLLHRGVGGSAAHGRVAGAGRGVASATVVIAGARRGVASATVVIARGLRHLKSTGHFSLFLYCLQFKKLLVI